MTSRRVPLWAIAAPAVLVAFAIVGGWFLWRSAPPPAPPTIALQSAANPEAAHSTAPPDAAVPPFAITAPTAIPATEAPAAPEHPEFDIETATEQQILDHVPREGAPDPTIFKFKANPRILVLDFASLLDQGRMLNRVAALVEKSGLPRDRLLSDSQLDAAIRANGDTVETFYYGHDYGAASLVRFFALADRDNVRLVTDEDRLGRLIRQAGWYEPNVHAALISIPQVGSDEHVTRSARAAILHHELSHGEYFTSPAYVGFVHRFWTQTLTQSERDRIRRHLHSLGYDSGLEEVMENEAQAYLMFTDSAEFFTPDMIGMSKPRLTELRNGFFRAMPAGWLRDSLGQTLSGNKATPAKP